MSKMKVEVIPCSATPLIYDEEKCNRLQRLCRDLPVRLLFCRIRKKGKPPIVMFPENVITVEPA